MVQADIANLRAAAPARPAGRDVHDGGLARRDRHVHGEQPYYPSTEDYICALAEAMKPEYDAIHQAGLILQLDCPDLACGWTFGERRTSGRVPQRSECGWRPSTTPPATSRPRRCGCTCAGATSRGRTTTTSRWPTSSTWCCGPGRPRSRSRAPTPATSMNGRSSRTCELPDGKVLMPGVIDSTTNYVEHPELVAQRIGRYAGLVGRENVIAGTDCGFATFVTHASSSRRSPGPSSRRWPREPGWPASGTGPARGNRSQARTGSARQALVGSLSGSWA